MSNLHYLGIWESARIAQNTTKDAIKDNEMFAENNFANRLIG